MRSPTDSALAATRRERVLRTGGIAALIALGVRLATAASPAAPSLRLTTSELPTALANATRHQAPTIHLTATRALGSDERDWLRALDRSGSRLTWALQRPIAPLAVQAEPEIAPDGRTSITVLAPIAAPVAIHDGVGLLDSLPVGPGGALSLSAATEGTLRVRSAAGEASVSARDSVTIRPVLVVGPAGWESKYVIAALEEAGWPVEERISVAPNVVVGRGSTQTLDTARLAAVVILDSLALRLPDVVRFVRSGGGAVVAPGAASLPSYAALAGAAPAERVRAELGALTTSEPRRGLSALTFRVRDTHSTVLERREGAPVLVARRLGAGRILLLGTDETWRWRMQGADGAVEAHRAWWSAAVTTVAYAPLPNTVTTVRGLDAAPLAAMYAVLGAPSSGRADRSAFPTQLLDAILLLFALLTLVGEWTSRRLRGAR